MIQELTLLMTLAANPPAAAAPKLEFEAEARVVAKGRNPKLLARRAHGLLMLYSAPAPGGNGLDLYVQTSNDVGDTFTPPVRVNHLPGEVSDHGENSAQLLASPDDTVLYVVWNGRDPKNPGGTVIRFARSGAMGGIAFTPAMTLNDDGQAISHSFQGAGVAPDGSLHVAWLDAREGLERGTAGITGGTTALWYTGSRDGGKTWSKNLRVAKGVCPCCRPGFGFVNGQVVVAWRGVESGDMRDIFFARSSDGGAAFSAPALLARDGWKIKGCPHVGPSLTAFDGKLHAVWYSEGAARPAIWTAHSADGQKWSAKQPVSEGTHDPTHPLVQAGDDGVAAVFQARDAARDKGWGRVAAYYRELPVNGGKLIALPAKSNVNYPSVAPGHAGRTFVAWTETRDDGPVIVLLRGRR